MIKQFRKYGFAALNESDSIIDRFDLNVTSDVPNMGFSIDIQTIKTPIEEILVKSIQNLQTFTITENYLEGSRYERALALRLWLQKYRNLSLAFYWFSEFGEYLCDCTVLDFRITELTRINTIAIPLKIKPLSPLFELSEQVITIKPGIGGKIYPVTYPYTYGIGVVSDNIIINNYPEDIPITITLFGEMINIGVSIREQGTATPYASVQFPNMSIAEGQYIVINGRKGTIKMWDGNFFTDAYDKLDANKQSFIRARAQTISELQADGIRSDKTGYLIATYRRYMQ